MTAIRYEVRDAVAEIVLDNPPANALDESMIGALADALERAGGDDSVRAVILRSAIERRFCAGLNLKLLADVTPERVRSLLERLYVRMNDAQFRLGKPSIAAVTGAARGGGMTVAIGCDLIVAGRSASFGYPEIDVGLLPAIHLTHLPRIVGRHRAFDLLFTGRSFDAAQASELGLVSRLVDDDRVLDEARSLAATLAAKSPTAMRIGRTAFHNANDNGYRQGVAAAVETFCALAATADAREGIAAFAAGRAPVWRGGQG